MGKFIHCKGSGKQCNGIEKLEQPIGAVEPEIRGLILEVDDALESGIRGKTEIHFNAVGFTEESASRIVVVLDAAVLGESVHGPFKT
jgi:hypothetical protein